MVVTLFVSLGSDPHDVPVLPVTATLASFESCVTPGLQIADASAFLWSVPCPQGTCSRSATGGSVTIRAIKPDLEGALDLHFGADHIAGNFRTRSFCR